MSFEQKIYHKVTSYLPFTKRIIDYFKKRRYLYLTKIIREQKSKRIMEIGLWDGEHALKMIKEAKRIHGQDVEYYGFDLFEEMNDNVCKNEVAKHPLSLSNIKVKLEATGCKVYLFKGFTNKTLPENVNQLPKMDFIFIDGGHSLETIENDWKYSQQLMSNNTIVVFDDYWNRDDLGCKKVIENIDRSKYNVKILPIQDKFKKDWEVLKINFVKVNKA